MDCPDMTRIIGGKRYSTRTGTCIAHDVFWDGHNMERHGRNTWLYRTPKGAYFLVTATQWQGERDQLRPVTVEEARVLYEGPLTEHELAYEEAFPNVTIEDA